MYLGDAESDVLAFDPCNPPQIVCVAAPCPQLAKPAYCDGAASLPFGKNTCSTPDGRQFSCGTSISCVTPDGRQGRTTDYFGRVCEVEPETLLSKSSPLKREAVTAIGIGTMVLFLAAMNWR